MKPKNVALIVMIMLLSLGAILDYRVQRTRSAMSAAFHLGWAP